MHHQSALAAAAMALLATSALAIPTPTEQFNSTDTQQLYPRATLDISTTTPSCQNTWETVTNDPVVQYWYLIVPDSGVSADRMWNHLNLNGCAPTENKYYSTPKNKGVALTFHTSEACTAARVSHAYRSSSNPPYNLGCTFTGKDGVDAGEAGATGIDAAFEAALEALGGGE